MEYFGIFLTLDLNVGNILWKIVSPQNTIMDLNNVMCGQSFLKHWAIVISSITFSPLQSSVNASAQHHSYVDGV